VIFRAPNSDQCARPWHRPGRRTESVLRSPVAGVGDTEAYRAQLTSRAGKARPECGVSTA